MASGPITSWQIEGGKVEAVTDYFLRYVIKSTISIFHQNLNFLLFRRHLSHLMGKCLLQIISDKGFIADKELESKYKKNTQNSINLKQTGQ